MIFYRYLGRTAAEVPAKFQSDTNISTPDYAPSRLCGISRWDVLSDVETGPKYLSNPYVSVDVTAPHDFWSANFGRTSTPYFLFCLWLHLHPHNIYGPVDVIQNIEMT